MTLPSAVLPAPTRRGAVLVPGLPVLPPNVERHPVPGGGTRTLTLDAGDELTVIDREGRQPCELVVFDATGRSDPAIIGANGIGTPLGTQAILDSEAPSAARVRAALSARGCDLARAGAVRLFGHESRAGESVSFTATARATLVASAPGGPMPVDEQCAPTSCSRVNRKFVLAADVTLRIATMAGNLGAGNFVDGEEITSDRWSSGDQSGRSIKR